MSKKQLIDRMNAIDHSYSLLSSYIDEIFEEIPELNDLDFFINDFDHGTLRIKSYNNEALKCITEYQHDLIEFSVHEIDTEQKIELMRYLVSKLNKNLED